MVISTLRNHKYRLFKYEDIGFLYSRVQIVYASLKISLKLAKYGAIILFKNKNVYMFIMQMTENETKAVAKTTHGFTFLQTITFIIFLISHYKLSFS